MQSNWLVMKQCVLVSVSDIAAEILAVLRGYWQDEGRKIVSYAVNMQGVPLAIDPEKHIVYMVLNTLITELFTERQTDMRNAGQLIDTEKVLMEVAKIDERTAHAIAEDLFSRVVNFLGMHLPDLTFSNHDDYKFKFVGRDLLIYKE
jgi:hypothetical protein